MRPAVCSGTFETYPASTRADVVPVLTTRVVTVKTATGFISGHFHILENPRPTFSVKEPQGGCGNFVNVSKSAAHYGKGDGGD